METNAVALCAGLPTPHALQATVQKQADQGDLSVSGFGGVGRPAPSPAFPRIVKRLSGKEHGQMAVHNWTRVSPGTYHDFHCRWITHLSEMLNSGVLPTGYYALSEQPAEETWPDVLALATPSDPGEMSAINRGPGGALAVAERPPQVSLSVTSEAELTALRQRTLVIRHASGDRIVALLEIVSPGNKDRKFSLDRFVDKAVSALRRGYHLLVVDLFPPGRHDLDGIHAAIWAAIDGAAASDYRQPVDRPLTLVAYEAKPAPTAYIEPLALGSSLPVMPLFVGCGWYVNVPLEATYMQAWHGMPERWRKVVEGGK